MKTRSSRRALRTAAGNWTGRSGYNRHTANPGYEAGNHWVECARCGFDIRESNAKKEWTGLVVCGGCWEPRQTQDFVRIRPDQTAATGLVRSTTADEFLPDYIRAGAVAGIAIAGRAIAGRDSIHIFAEGSLGVDKTDSNPADSGGIYSTYNIDDPIGS